jgi:hypothetical protein
MIRRVVFASIVIGSLAPRAMAQAGPGSTQPPTPSPSTPVYASPQSPPRAELAEVPPPPPRPVVASKPEDQSVAAKRSITRQNPLPHQKTASRVSDSASRRDPLSSEGRFANPGGVGRFSEYYTANTLSGSPGMHQAYLARFDRGGGPDRAEQIAAFRAGQMRTANIQNNINAYGRPYGAYGAGFGFGLGLSGAAGFNGGGFR